VGISVLYFFLVLWREREAMGIGFLSSLRNRLIEKIRVREGC